MVLKICNIYVYLLYSVSLISRNGMTEQNKWWYYTPRIIIGSHHLHLPKKLNLNANKHTIKSWKWKVEKLKSWKICTQFTVDRVDMYTIPLSTNQHPFWYVLKRLLDIALQFRAPIQMVKCELAESNVIHPCNLTFNKKPY